MHKLARTLSVVVTCLSPLAPALVGCGLDTPPSGPVSDSCEVTKTLEASGGAQGQIFGQCFDVSPAFDTGGQAQCLVLDLRPAGGACACDPSEGLAPVAAEHQSAVPEGTGCACELQQIVGLDEETCQNDDSSTPQSTQTDTPLNGWCFIDATTEPPRGDLKLTSACPETEKRLLRLVGAPSLPSPTRQILMICEGVAGKGCSG